MNDKFTNNTNDDENIARKLDQVADQTIINAQFASELEESLRTAHQPKVNGFESSFKQISPTLRWVALVILLGLVLNWSIRSLIHAPQPGINGTPAMPHTATPSPEIVITGTPTPAGADGGYDWRGSKLYLDVPLPTSPAEANISLLQDEQPANIDTARAVASQFGIQGEIFETPGRLPGTISYLVTDGKQRLYVQSSLNYDYYADYGAYSYLSGGKNISEEQAATVIDAFMKSHGLNFEYKLENPQINPGMYYVLPLTPDRMPVYHNYNIPERLEFTVDENEQVILMTSYQIRYEIAGAYGIRTADEAFQQVLNQSDAIQNGVLEIVRSAGISNAGFWSRSYPDNETITIYAQPTSYSATEPDGVPFISIGQHTAIGNIIGIESVDSSTYIEATGQFITENGIRKFNVETWKITDAIEASIMGTLQREDEQTVLTSDMGDQYIFTDIPADVPLNTNIPDEQLIFTGVMANGNFIWNSIQYFPVGSNFGGGGGGGTGFYKLNLSGTPVPFPTPKPETNQGTVEYIVKEGDSVFAIAEAYRVTSDEIFQANDWLSEEHALMPGKTLIIPVPQTNSGSSEYIVQENDTLASIALNFGVTVDELMQANGITDNTVFLGQTLIIPPGQVTSGQGITLPEEQLTHLEIGQRLEGERGIFQVNIYQTTQLIWYGFFEPSTEKSNMPYLILENTDLQNLHKYNNLPINIWGTIDRLDEVGRPIVKVDRYEVPYPDLQFQIFEGTQQIAEIQGQTVILFIAKDGKTYVELTGIGTPFDGRGVFGQEGDQILVEGLAIPDERFGDYPCLRVFSVNYLIDPASGQPNEMTITANQVNIYEEPPASPENYTTPTATIEKVELVYYTPDPRYAQPDSNAGEQYIQPAWRFYGHYSNGDEFAFLVQALKQEYLLPELAPYTPPG